MAPRFRSPLVPVAALITAVVVPVVIVVGAPSLAVPNLTSTVFINELHYDNDGTDEGETIEIAGPAGTDLAGWSIVLYNGAVNTSYNTLGLAGVVPDQGGGYGTLAFSYPENGIQNGPMDGIALVRPTNVLVQFLSYEGMLTATNGPAAGSTSTDIGVSEPGSGPVGTSIQLTGTGTTYGDFSWSPPAPASFGAVNAGQTFSTTTSSSTSSTSSTTTTTTVAEPSCGDPATPIHDIQGPGTGSPLVGAPGVGRSIEGVVVGDFQGSGQFGGFYVQEEDADADADPATSEGIFVFSPLAVAAGRVVRVRGDVVELASGTTTLTELTRVTSVLDCGPGGVTPTAVLLPVASVDDWERYEGMRISLPQPMAVTETFTLGRFGEVGLSLGSRLLNPTSVAAPGAPARAVQELNNRRRILLDDGNNQQNIDPTLYPAGGLSASNTLRSGDTATGVHGVLDQRFSLYRIQPVGAVLFTSTNPRPASPADVGGAVTVASMNVLNFFNGNGLGDGFPTPRGAETPLELQRQRDKIVSAIVKMDAHIVGLMEIENDAPPNSAIEELTAALNAAAGAGTYAFVDTGVVGTDQIRVALLYQPATVTPRGGFAILTSAVDPRFIDTLNRPALAQTFSENANGQRFTVVVNHLKSKGSACNAVGDPDTGDGQGNCNTTRTNAATALVDWLATDPTGSGDDNVLIIGDLNAYAQEDPIAALENGGYTNLVESFLGPGAYSFVFEGQSGYLDHALANESFEPQVTGVTEWHINADEPIALDYNTNFKTPNHVQTLYAPTPFRSSDHDPVIVGVCQSPLLAMSVTPNVLWPPNHNYRTIIATPTASSDVRDIELLSVTSNEPDDGDDDGNTTNDIVIIDDLIARLRAERSETGSGRVYTFTWEATNACGATTTATATVSVPLG